MNSCVTCDVTGCKWNSGKFCEKEFIFMKSGMCQFVYRDMQPRSKDEWQGTFQRKCEVEDINGVKYAK